jgi:hypothetical protein
MNPTVDNSFTAKYILSGRIFVLCLLGLMSFALITPDAYAKKGGGSGGGGGGTTTTSCGNGKSGTVSGTVTNNYGVSLAGASVTFSALTVSCSTTTNSSGAYSIKVPVATYDVSFAAANHASYTVSGSVIKNKSSSSLNAVLTADAAVIVTASIGGSPAPGAALPATGSYIILDGSTVVSTNWTQSSEGVAASISDPSSNNPTVTLASASVYAEHLINVLEEPPITEADLPPDLVLQPINEIRKGLQDRDQVVAINPLALEKTEGVSLTYSVTTTSGTYSASASAVTHLPWVTNTGVRTVPLNVPVLLYAKDGAGYNWAITSQPSTSTATLTNAATQTPWFTPDAVGSYELEETNSGAVVEVHAGRYRGVIDPILTLDSVVFGDGRPVADESCTGCHTDGGAAPDKFTPWRQTGHAEAFTQGITTNGHFGEACFACHTVGFGLDGPLAPGGIDDTPNYGEFMSALSDAQHGGDISAMWTTMLADMPDTARLSNIQCESCHGPQSYAESHHTPDGMGTGTPRISLAADVCGSCHGEPGRHGRFQQWQLSNHADYDLARSRGTNGNCARCHSGNGFVAWSELDFDPAQQVDVTWDQDTVVPQTCAACHDPHDTGTTSGSDDTNAKVRIMGDTHLLLAGFVAENVGKGATCMTCHNSRADVPRNDATWASLSTSQKTGSPHHGVQADLVMGQNLFFTGAIPVPGNHALIEDVCVTCHMDATQPPDILSYNQTGTNHTFAADPGVCVNCHGLAGETLAETVDNEITGYLNTLQAQLGAGWKRLMEANYPITGSGCDADGVSSFITDVQWVYSRGTRLAISVDGVSCGSSVNPSSISGNGTSLQDLALGANDGAIYKAAWNYGLNYEDETINGCVDSDDTTCSPPHTHRGVHNHAFSQQGLLGAISAVQAVAP